MNKNHLYGNFLKKINRHKRRFVRISGAGEGIQTLDSVATIHAFQAC